MQNLFKMFMILSLTIFSPFSFAQSPATPTDADITTSVNSQLSTNAALSGTNIKAASTNGVVTLTGSADTDTQVSTATEIAQSTPGVKDVNTTNLTVKGSQQPISDALITAKVKGLFIQQKLFGNTDVAVMSIKVETNGGVVYLSGTADNQTQIDNAIQLAKSVSGVTDVKSTVQIKPLNSTN